MSLRLSTLGLLSLFALACEPASSGSNDDTPRADGTVSRDSGGLPVEDAAVEQVCEDEAKRCGDNGVEICAGDTWVEVAPCPAGTACEDGECVEGMCTPDCTDRACGGDGCGGVCGMCVPGWSCGADGSCSPPPPACGDATCNANEDCSTCPADCGNCCGNGECSAIENCATCPADCACPEGENCDAEARTCGQCEPQCEGRECGADGCGAECGQCEGGVACNNGLCEVGCQPQCNGRACGPDGCDGQCGDPCPGEQLCNAEGQCAEPPAACGDDRCDAATEDCSNCPADCGQCCGNGECGAVENCSNCPADCGCEEGSACNQERQACVVECVPQCDGRDCGADGCEGFCGANAGGCGENQACEEGVCRDLCVPACEGRDCGGDGCNGTCGDGCEGDELCNDGVCEAACVPACEGVECGGDGCEGICRECDEGFFCQEGRCEAECVPACEGKACGDDGCNGTCDPGCDDGFECDDAGQCEEICVPRCEGLQCGPDGCDGVCGPCDGEGMECREGMCVPEARFCDCIGDEVCLDGFCRAPEQLCSPENPVGLCAGGGDCLVGECQNRGAACSPQNPTGVCELGAICRDGACMPFDGAALCDDHNPCTEDRFDHIGNRCLNAPANLDCEDGNGCTVNACEAGACVAERVPGCVEPPTLDPYVTPTNENVLVLAGTKPEGASIFINGEEAVPENPQARWSVQINLVPGENVFEVFSRDGGQDSASIIARVIYDITPPGVRSSPEGGIFLNPITITAAADEASTVYFTDDGGTPDEWSRSFQSVRQFRIFHDTTLRFRARDVAGNWQDAETRAEFEITSHGNGWRDGPALPEPRTLFGATYRPGSLYIAGGTDGLASQAGVWRYDFAAAEWADRPALNGGRAQLAMVELGGFIYVIGGEDDAVPLNANQRLEVNGEAWENRAPMPSTRFGLAAVAHNNRIYAFGGKTNGGLVLGNLEVYDPGSNTWNNMVAQMPRPRYGLAAIEHGGLIYLLGGEDGDGNPIAEVEVYNPANDQWAQIADLPTARSFLTVTKNHNAGAIEGGYTGLVVAGGRIAGGAATAVVEEYVIDDEHWRERTPLDQVRHSAAAIHYEAQEGIDGGEIRGLVLGGLVADQVADGSSFYTQRQDYAERAGPMPGGRFMHAAETLGSRIYIFGGRSFQETQLVWAFDPETGRYDELPELPTVQNGLGSAVWDEHLYAIGGANGFGNAVPTLRRYDPAHRMWHPLAPMPTGRRDAAVAVLDGEIWVIGGDNNGALQTVEIYDPAEDAWRQGPALPAGRTGARAIVHDGALLLVGGLNGAGAHHGNALRLQGDQWPQAFAGVDFAHAQVVLTHDHQLNIFGGQAGAGITNTIRSIDLGNGNTVSRDLLDGQNLTTGVDFGAVTSLNGRIYIVGGNTSPELGPEGETAVQRLDAYCFNGVLDGREEQHVQAPYDNGGTCPGLRTCSGTLYGNVCFRAVSASCQQGSANAWCAGRGARVATVAEYRTMFDNGWRRPNSSYHTMSVADAPGCNGGGAVYIPEWNAGNAYRQYQCGDNLNYCSRSIICVE